MVVQDALADPRFATNRLVTGAPHIRFYAGVPLVSVEGVPLGALCALGDRPKVLRDEQIAGLRALATMTMDLLEARRGAGRLARAMHDLTVAQREQAQARQDFEAVFDHAPNGMTLTGPDGTYARVNASFAELVGRTPAELVGSPAGDTTVEADRADDRADLETLVAHGTRSVLREKRYLHRDGSSIPALVTASLVRPQADRPGLVLHQVESIAERRAAEERLTELHSAVDAIISIDSAGRVTSWNRGAERMLGHSAADMRGKTLHAIIPPTLWGAHDQGLARQAAGAPLTLESATVPALRADGRELLVELSLAKWEQGEAAGYTAVLRDISDRHRAEQLADLVRQAAVIANDATTLVDAAPVLIEAVCSRLGWSGGHAWTEQGSGASWYVAPHAHEPGARCMLASLAASRSMPDPAHVPMEARSRWTASLPENPISRRLRDCGVVTGLAVPVLTGDGAGGMLAFYGADTSLGEDHALMAALEQVGIILGRVVEREATATLHLRQAREDALTGLVNRRVLLEQISAAQDATARRRADDPSYALLMLDLDRFKLVNDSLGHTAGDVLLQEVARRLTAVVRDEDTVARLGGDEFVVLCRLDPGVAPAEAAAGVAERVLAALARPPVDLAGTSVQLRASAGVCVLEADHGEVGHYPAAVLRDADAALRLAKRRGAARYEVFDDGMRGDAALRMAEEAALAAGIAGDELVVHYQPVFDLQTGRAVGAEALVRWERPGHGLVPPGRFIPLAEESGLVVELGRWVLRRACAEAAGWAATAPALAGGTVSVNVSARQLNHPAFLVEVGEALSESGLPDDRLVLEITETSLVDDTAAILEVLDSLRARGVRLALDDFGTGYSSLGYVQALPVDVLKIDKSFVDPITAHGHGTSLSEVVLKLAEATGLRTVAEGIESRAQADVLRRLGCELGQGFALARPVPLGELEAACAGAALDRQPS
jgi:diguanylate cyclase (GGDEF)-like protein/PAS domain S-box-containing protein